MLRRLKVPSFVWKCVFYRSELTWKLELDGIEILSFWNVKKKNISTYWTQYVDLKNGAIRLVMFTPRFMANKMPKNGSFYVLSGEYSKKYLGASKTCYLALLENATVYGVLRYH